MDMTGRRDATLHVPERKQHDLADERVVGHHHRDGSEQRFEVVRQRTSPSITGIHRDVHGELGVHVDVRVFENAARLAPLHLWTYRDETATRCSQRRLDGVTVASCRVDAIDANFKLKN